MSKKKSKNAVAKKKKEFRYHKVQVKSKNGKIVKIRHPSYIFLEKGNIFIFVTITHSNKVENELLIKLRENPNPNDKRKSYWVARIKFDTKDRFGKRDKRWKMNKQDDEDIRAFNNKNSTNNK